MKNVRNKIESLSKPAWTYQDIMVWCEVSKATAIKIKNRAIFEQNGAIAYGDNYVKSDSVLKLFGSTREEEIKLLRSVLNEEDVQENVPQD